MWQKKQLDNRHFLNTQEITVKITGSNVSRLPCIKVALMGINREKRNSVIILFSRISNIKPLSICRDNLRNNTRSK